jgi:hypothetical protein
MNEAGELAFEGEEAREGFGGLEVAFEDEGGEEGEVVGLDGDFAGGIEFVEEFLEAFFFEGMDGGADAVAAEVGVGEFFKAAGKVRVGDVAIYIGVMAEEALELGELIVRDGFEGGVESVAGGIAGGGGFALGGAGSGGVGGVGAVGKDLSFGGHRGMGATRRGAAGAGLGASG